MLGTQIRVSFSKMCKKNFENSREINKSSWETKDCFAIIFLLLCNYNCRRRACWHAAKISGRLQERKTLIMHASDNEINDFITCHTKGVGQACESSRFFRLLLLTVIYTDQLTSPFLGPTSPLKYTKSSLYPTSLHRLALASQSILPIFTKLSWGKNIIWYILVITVLVKESHLMLQKLSNYIKRTNQIWEFVTLFIAKFKSKYYIRLLLPKQQRV